MILTYCYTTLVLWIPTSEQALSLFIGLPASWRRIGDAVKQMQDVRGTVQRLLSQADCRHGSAGDALLPGRRAGRSLERDARLAGIRGRRRGTVLAATRLTSRGLLGPRSPGYRNVSHRLRQALQELGRPRLALPDGDHCPSCRFKRVSRPPVSPDVGRELLFPELTARGRRRRIPATGMAMPEAAMHEHGETSSGKHQVGLPRKRAVMQDISESRGMQIAPHHHLRLGVLAADRGHHPAACYRIDYVCHARLL